MAALVVVLVLGTTACADDPHASARDDLSGDGTLAGIADHSHPPLESAVEDASPGHADHRDAAAEDMAFAEDGICGVEEDHAHDDCSHASCPPEPKNNCPSANWGWRPAMPYPSGVRVVITRSWACLGGHSPGGSAYAIDSVSQGSRDILAVADGTVRSVRRDCPNVWTNCTSTTRSTWPHNCGGGFGNSVVIEHAGGVFSRYAHLEPNSIPSSIQPGARVCTGLVIGTEGGSGCTWSSWAPATGAGRHLHFQMQSSATGGSIVSPGWQGMNVIPQNSGTFTSTTTRRTSCPAPCTHACSAGARRCAGDGRYETCADHNSNGCRSWGGATNCPSGQVCRGSGTCCSETCTGGRQCVSDHEFESCADHNGNGCRTFGARQSCGEGRGCRGDGECYDLWQAAPGKACAEDADCGWDRVCRFREAGGFCTAACAADADCPADSLCAIRGSATFCAPDAAAREDSGGAGVDGTGDEDADGADGELPEDSATEADPSRCRPGLVVDLDDAERWHCAPDCRLDPGLCGSAAQCGADGVCIPCRCEADMCGVLSCGVDCGRCPDGERCGSDHRCVRPAEEAGVGTDPATPGTGDDGVDPDGNAEASDGLPGHDMADDATAGDEEGDDDATRPPARREGGGVTRAADDDDGGPSGASGTGCTIADVPLGGNTAWGLLLIMLGLARLRRAGDRGAVRGLNARGREAR